MVSYGTITRLLICFFVLVCLINTCKAGKAVASAAAAAAAGEAQSCAAMYLETDTPLLFGGVHKGCYGSRCQPRQDKWSNLCDPVSQPQPNRGHAVCSAQQKAAVLEHLRKEPDFAAAMREFTPCALNTYLRGRTLWLLGDSLMRNNYYALRCFMLDFWDHGKGECALDPRISVQHNIYTAADTNHTSALGSIGITDMPKCVHLLDGGRICWVNSVRGEEFAAPDAQNPGVLQVLQNTVAKSDDIFFINFGRFHYANCFGLEEGPYVQSQRELGALYKRTKADFPNMIFKTISADHNHCNCSNMWSPACLPAEEGSCAAEVGRQVVSISEQILGRCGVPVVNTWNVSKDMHLGHILLPRGGLQKDCTHYCSPGMPEWELWNMYKEIRTLGIKPLSQAATDGHPACVRISDIRPPPGWSYYYDQIKQNNSKPQQMQQPSGL